MFSLLRYNPRVSLTHAVRKAFSTTRVEDTVTIVQSGCVRTRCEKPRPFPTLFFFPGLNSQPIHDTSGIQWIKDLEDNTEAILKEYRNVISSRPSDYTIVPGEQTLHTGSWDWRSFVLKGEWQNDLASACPVTAKLLQNTPLLTGIPMAYTFFSTLEARGKISAHYGSSNLRLRLHLPLVAPKGSYLVVAGEKVEWKVGKAILFDDTYAHEAHNPTDSERVVLLVDVWHPDLTEEEQEGLVNMFRNAGKS